MKKWLFYPLHGTSMTTAESEMKDWAGFIHAGSPLEDLALVTCFTMLRFDVLFQFGAVQVQKACFQGYNKNPTQY